MNLRPYQATAVEQLREGIRQGTELCSLAIHQKGFQDFVKNIGPGKGKLTAALQQRDEQFGDYRTSATKPEAPGE